MQIIVHPDGTVRCLYGEVFDVHTLGRPVIRRGSHVEPNEAGEWTADLSPVGGPLLGPYRSRSEALRAEREWLQRHWLIPHGPLSR